MPELEPLSRTTGEGGPFPVSTPLREDMRQKNRRSGQGYSNSPTNNHPTSFSLRPERIVLVR
jgi:hypothetical protein